MNLLLGASGEIGSCLSKRDLCNISHSLPRSELNDWIAGGEGFIRQKLINYLDESNNEVGIFYCVGNTNPNASVDELDTLNFELPKSIAKASIDLPFRLITFGSVHEDSKISNPYMDSKRKYRDFLISHDLSFNWNHFQLHTLYSENLPKPYMFLGQMLDALSTGKKFKMSSGSQFRQFHHTSDVVGAIESSLLEISVNSVIQISSNDSIRLVDLALTVFSSVGDLKNLNVGTLGDNKNEIYSTEYPVSEFLKDLFFRDPLMEIPRIISNVWLPTKLSGYFKK